MNGNGASHYATLAARVDALEAAVQILTRRWEEMLTPRLVALEQDVDQLAGERRRRTEQ